MGNSRFGFTSRVSTPVGLPSAELGTGWLLEDWQFGSTLAGISSVPTGSVCRLVLERQKEQTYLLKNRDAYIPHKSTKLLTNWYSDQIDLLNVKVTPNSLNMWLCLIREQGSADTTHIISQRDKPMRIRSHLVVKFNDERSSENKDSNIESKLMVKCLQLTGRLRNAIIAFSQMNLRKCIQNHTMDNLG
ncbi:hypothetical protein B0J17DRAFT_634105 [Rhizoctonia solani]|nr:hypothetical protein B0J17DRAFT_634105 [Rhizoctonia solani]